MIRKLLLLGALVVMVSESVYGLGLGKLELRSALNQEFDAEIELTNVRDLEIDEILPRLASSQDFARVGMERNYLLTDLRFNVVAKGNGKLAIRIRSQRPIVEPFLNFIVEVLWPNGRILREYTVLLDPPVMGEQGVQALRPAESGRPSASSGSSSATSAAPAVSRQAQSTAQPGPLEEGSVAGGEYGMTGPGDTLWAIAVKVRPDDSVSVQQTML
ncbi:MAG: peptigoglycan-binding protein LysM, partial [Pseudomonadales bacterium]